MPISLNNLALHRILFWPAVVGLPLACSAARLDPSTRAFTFDTPALVGSATPSTTPTAAAVAGSPPTRPIQATSASSQAPGSPPANATAKTTETVTTEPTAHAHTCSRLPDPRATVTDDWVRLTVSFDRGKLALVRAKHERMRRAEPSARRMGRFAAELWIGCELIDRVRFDFPLLGAEPPAQKDKQPPAINFESLGRYEAELWIPNSERATRLEIRDRTRESDSTAVVTLAWPLSVDPTLAPPASRPLQ